MKKLLLLLLIAATAATAASTIRRPVDLEVQYMFYACDPCSDAYKVLKSHTRAGDKLVGWDITIKYRGDNLYETIAADDPQHARFRVVGTVSLLGHRVEASSVKKLW